MTASPAKTMAETAVEFGLKPDEYAVILKRLTASPISWNWACSR